MSRTMEVVGAQKESQEELPGTKNKRNKENDTRQTEIKQQRRHGIFKDVRFHPILNFPFDQRVMNPQGAASGGRPALPSPCLMWCRLPLRLPLTLGTSNCFEIKTLRHTWSHAPTEGLCLSELGSAKSSLAEWNKSLSSKHNLNISFVHPPGPGEDPDGASRKHFANNFGSNCMVENPAPPVGWRRSVPVGVCSAMHPTFPNSSAQGKLQSNPDGLGRVPLEPIST